MPVHAHVSVRAEDAPAVLEALLALYGARADALAEAAGRTDADLLQDARTALMDADAALDAFGWDRGLRLHAADLVGSPLLVGEVLGTAAADATESLERTLESYGRGEATLTGLATVQRQLIALLELFAAHEREHAV
jgi:hypothetical protein